MVYTIIAIISILAIIALTAKIQIQIKTLEYFSNKQKPKSTKLQENYKAKIQIIILNKIPITNTKITKEKLTKLQQNSKTIQKIKKEITKKNIKTLQKEYNLTTGNIIKNITQIIKKIIPTIKELDLKLELGTENAALTALLIPIISTTLSLIIAKNEQPTKTKSNKNKPIKKVKTKKQTNQKNYTITPIYQNKNIINIKLKGTIEIKIINLIKIIYKTKNKKDLAQKPPYDILYKTTPLKATK